MINLLIIAVLFGGLIGLFFDIFRLARMILLNNVATFILDVLFSVVASIITFVYLLAYNNGSIRTLYLLLELVGFAFYLLTIGQLTFAIEKAISVHIRKIIAFFTKKVKKMKEIYKKLLQKYSSVLYNKSNLKVARFLPLPNCKKKENYNDD